ncbi:hypothetical protein TCAL_09651 [Tigriopus californicus]|uniref:Uncharacterized protein n=1 Tax=Tigriopus californicus TaxID=6832 RepID=A0A553NVL2_TIGCA|nr:uncharacterized protein LOC131883873 [Tigriopus californicus]TRY69467.1 hypothetical protein TCAL_09651 [Tigriopus californicus]
MRPKHLCWWAVGIILATWCVENSSQDGFDTSFFTQDDEYNHEQQNGQARVFTSFIFPFFRQYQTIDIGNNLNNLKSPNTVAFFVIRDAIAYLALVTTWIVMHTIFWNGRLRESQVDQVPLFIRLGSGFINRGKFASDSLFGRKEGDFPEDIDFYEEDDEFQTKFGQYQDPAEDKLITASLNEISANAIFNFFSDPNPSFRNLIMNSGFLAFQLVLWFLPTFFWPGTPLPTPQNMNTTINSPGEGLGVENPIGENRIGVGVPIAENRVGALVHNLGVASPVSVYNRLLCPQCFVQTISIASLLYLGKLFWWWWFSSIPDFQRFSIRPRERSMPRSFNGERKKKRDDDDLWRWSDMALESLYKVVQFSELRMRQIALDLS